MTSAGGFEIRELATPLISTSQPAGPLQQVMSPTLGQGYGTTAHHSNHPHLPEGMVRSRYRVQRHHLRTRTQVQKVLDPWLREGHLVV